MIVYDDMGHEIAQMAYELYERSGRVGGRDIENWIEAERIVMAHYSAKKQLEEVMAKATEQTEEVAHSKKRSEKIKPKKKTAAEKTAKKTTTKKIEAKVASKTKRTKK